MVRRTIARSELRRQLSRLGVRTGGVLVVHTSFRAVRPVEDGPLGLIEALRDAVGSNGTVVMPTMTAGDSVFDPATTPTLDMGITAETFWRQPRVRRSTHPGASFAAFGPEAERICAPQPLSPPHGPDSPVGRVHELGGQVLLLGVTHGENTTMHLAEAMANVPYSVSHPCVVEVGGAPHTIQIEETDHCCEHFQLVDGWLGNRQRRGLVGHADSRLCDSRDIVGVVRERLAVDPLTFLCPLGAECEECDRARASVASHD